MKAIAVASSDLSVTTWNRQASDVCKSGKHLCVDTVEFHNKKLANFSEIVELSLDENRDTDVNKVQLWSRVEKQVLTPSCRFVLMMRKLREVNSLPSDVVV